MEDAYPFEFLGPGGTPECQFAGGVLRPTSGLSGRAIEMRSSVDGVAAVVLIERGPPGRTVILRGFPRLDDGPFCELGA
jgi:hypothetical protein